MKEEMAFAGAIRLMSEDLKEGPTTLDEKRAPVWKGK